MLDRPSNDHFCQKMKNQMDRKPQCKKFSSSNEDIKLFPTKLVRNVDFRDEVGEAIDNKLKFISNDSNYKYLQNSKLLKLPK